MFSIYNMLHYINVIGNRDTDTVTFNSEVTFNNLTLTLTLPAFKYFVSFLFDT